MKKLPGNHSHKQVGPVTLGCMDPDARDLMDRALKEFEKHTAEMREMKPGYRQSVYGFAYWLFRWSGLIDPKGKVTE